MTQDGNEHTVIVAQASARQTVRAEAKAATGPVEPHAPSPELSRILRVVPVIQTQTQQGLTLTVVSLESYADACTVRFLAQIPKVAYTRFQLPEIVEVRDDRGRRYRTRSMGGGGGGAGRGCCCDSSRCSSRSSIRRPRAFI